MLRLRICPDCQEEVRSPRAYFCHRCGAELPSSPDLPSARGGFEADSDSVETYCNTSPPKGKPKNRKLKIVVATPARLASRLVAGGLVVAFLAIAGIVVYYFRTNPLTLLAGRQVSLPSPPKNEAFVAEVSFEIENHPFSAKGLSEIVPADVDLYLESVDPEILLPSLVSAEDWGEVEAFFNEQMGLTLVEAASFLEDEFAVVQESTASAFLARVRDTDFVEQKISEFGEYDGWQAKMVNGFLVVSDSPELIHAVEEAQKKLTLNLSLTSGFAEARQKLPRTGQMFYYGKKRLGFIPDGVKGEAFVISKKDNGVLITGL